jgi:hypothetical protein
MKFEKFNLTEVTSEQVINFGEGIEIWEWEQDEQSQYVNMHGAERTLVLMVRPYGGNAKHFLMTLK